jgi:hypothetical protein
LNRIILDLKSGSRLRQRQAIQGWIVQVDDSLAVKAHKMMMAVRFDLVAARCPRVTHLSSQPDPNERLQNPIYGRAGHLPHFFSDIVKYLVCGGVIRAARQSLQNQAPLDGEGQRVLTANIFQFLRVRANSASNRHKGWNSIASGIECQLLVRRAAPPDSTGAIRDKILQKRD